MSIILASKQLNIYVLIPTPEEAMKLRPYRIYRQTTGSYFWQWATQDQKSLFFCSGNRLQIFKYQPFEQTLCIDTYKIIFVYQKMEL